MWPAKLQQVAFANPQIILMKLIDALGIISVESFVPVLGSIMSLNVSREKSILLFTNYTPVPSLIPHFSF